MIFLVVKLKDMIKILNIGGNQLGNCNYEISLNNSKIASFEHNRAEGLSMCLQKAAAAVKKAKWEEIADKLIELQKL